MTEQEVFNTVYVHLMNQQIKSFEGRYSEACAYRGYDGLKCAIGCLIPDEDYTVQMEGRVVGDLLEAFPKLGKSLGIFIDLLEHLQKVHDNVEVTHWPQSLAVVAHTFNLELPNLES